MSPEEKERINKLLKEMGGKFNVDELEAMRKRAFRTLEEWSSQDAATRDALPQDVQDMKMIARYTVLMSVSGMVPLIAALGTVEMVVEASYNLGIKAAPTPPVA